MIEVLGTWDIGYHAPITEQYYWALALRDFKVDKWHMAPVSGINLAEPAVDLTEWKTYEDFFAVNQSQTRVFIEPRTAHQNPDTTWLHEFNHPSDCIYIFGSAHYNPTMQHCREQDTVVSIKTNDDKGVLWADQAMCITLYDRMTKSWR